MIGTRPAATSIVRRMTSVCSATSSVADSPVVPTDTIAAEPASIMRSTSLRECLVVDRAVRPHRGDQRDDAARDHGVLRSPSARYWIGRPRAARTRLPAVVTRRRSAGRVSTMHASRSRPVATTAAGGVVQRDPDERPDRRRPRSRRRRCRTARPRRRSRPRPAARPRPRWRPARCRRAARPRRRWRRCRARWPATPSPCRARPGHGTAPARRRSAAGSRTAARTRRPARPAAR